MALKQTVLITGCSDDGIGYGLAAQFQQRGYHVFATARNISKMSKLKDLDNVTLLQLDVVDPAHIKAAVEAVSKHTGGTLDYLISNAGHNHFMPILDEDLDTVKALFDVNVFGPMALTKAFAPLVIKAKGSIAFVTSISGYINIPWMGKQSNRKGLSSTKSCAQARMLRRNGASSSSRKRCAWRLNHSASTSSRSSPVPSRRRVRATSATSLSHRIHFTSPSKRRSRAARKETTGCRACLSRNTPQLLRTRLSSAPRASSGMVRTRIWSK
jgi:NAD(P)-dependent dehydrogenase (short-subunit alcohol dehydrogenase family)